MSLETELLTYRRELDRLLTDGEAGRFAVIYGTQVAGTWNSYHDALEWGYERYGLGTPFMVRKVDPRDRERLEHCLLRPGP
jgi:hypothetical protein